MFSLFHIQARGNPPTGREPPPAVGRHGPGGMEQQLMGLLSSVQDYMRECCLVAFAPGGACMCPPCASASPVATELRHENYQLVDLVCWAILF